MSLTRLASPACLLSRPLRLPAAGLLAPARSFSFGSATLAPRRPTSALEHFTSNRSWPSSFPPFFSLSYGPATHQIPRPYFSHRSFGTSTIGQRQKTASANPHHKPSHPPTLTQPVVAYYLLAIAALVFALVVLGGLTRLTESGLSITEWNLVTGILPPLTKASWQAELDKYKATPEGES